MENDDTNTEKLIEELAQLAVAWRVRGFDILTVCAALTAGTLAVLGCAGVTCEQAKELVDHHYTASATITVRPSVKA